VICQSFKLSVVPYLFDSDEVVLIVDLGSSLNVVGKYKKGDVCISKYISMQDSKTYQVIVT
jgi:hypothetical protein